MTYEQISEMIEGIGVPYAYDHFEEEEAVDPPFICFMYPSRTDFHADGISYTKITELRIELYTDNVDFDLEARVEAVLENADICYSKLGPTYISSEKMYDTTYEMSVLLDSSDG